MKLLFAKSRWEIENLSYSEYIARTARDGFEVLEINALTLSDRKLPEFAREARSAGLRSLVQGLTFAPTPEEQMEELERQVGRAIPAECFRARSPGRVSITPADQQGSRETADSPHEGPRKGNPSARGVLGIRISMASGRSGRPPLAESPTLRAGSPVGSGRDDPPLVDRRAAFPLIRGGVILPGACSPLRRP